MTTQPRDGGYETSLVTVEMKLAAVAAYLAKSKSGGVQPVPLVDAIDAAIRAQWQPIETAPKDGTVVDLWAAGERLTGFAWRNTGVIGWTRTEGYPAITRVLRGNKCTHWMPAPEEPTT